MTPPANILVLSITGIVLSSCVTIDPPPPFESFPDRFDATQVVTVRLPKSSPTAPASAPSTLVASIHRDGEALTMTFVDPVWQSPLLRVAWSQGQYDTQWLREGISLPFSPEEIVDAAREVFRWRGHLKNESQAEFTTIRFTTRLSELSGSKCRLPKLITMTSRLPDGPTIEIATKEWQCAKPSRQ